MFFFFGGGNEISCFELFFMSPFRIKFVLNYDYVLFFVVCSTTQTYRNFFFTLSIVPLKCVIRNLLARCQQCWHLLRSHEIDIQTIRDSILFSSQGHSLDDKNDINGTTEDYRTQL